MNKCLVFSRFKGFIFVLKFSFEYNIDFIYHKKKAVELSFCSRFKIFVSMVSALAFAFKLIGPIIFSAFKKVSFPQSKHFSTFKKLFQSQTIVKELLHKNIFFYQGSFPQTKTFTHSKYFSANEDQKCSLIAKIVDPFNTKSYEKLFLTL